MRLQILINHYQESQDIVGRQLESIAMQTGVDHNSDYEVLIGSDGTENQLDSAFLDSFPFHIEYIVRQHKGTRAMRNTLLDMATADYIMLCDADDCFTESNGLSVLLEAANDGNPDVVSVPFYAELNVDGELRCVKYPNNCMWLAGSIFKKQYLSENGIRFDDVSNYGEVYFLWQAFKLTNHVRYLPDCFYMYKWNENSTTRADPYFRVKNYGKSIESYSRLAIRLHDIGRDDLRDELVAGTISNTYIHSNQKRWIDSPSEYLVQANEAIAKYIRMWRSVYESIPPRERKNIYNEALIMRRTYGPLSGFEGIKQWMDGVS